MQLSVNTQSRDFHSNRSSRKRLSIVAGIALLLLLAFWAYYSASPSIAPLPSNEQVIPQVQPPSLLENTSITTTVTLQHGSFTVVHTKTGVKVTLTGSSLPDGSQINVTSIYYGPDPPEVHVVNTSTCTVSLSGIAYYDLKVTLANGDPLNSDVNALVYISNPRFEGTEKLPLLFYWNNKAWASVNTQTVEADTLSGPFRAAQLSGTLIGVGALQVSVIPIHVIPECPLGTFLAVLSCFAAFALQRIRKKPTCMK